MSFALPCRKMTSVITFKQYFCIEFQKTFFGGLFLVAVVNKSFNMFCEQCFHDMHARYAVSNTSSCLPNPYWSKKSTGSVLYIKVLPLYLTPGTVSAWSKSEYDTRDVF